MYVGNFALLSVDLCPKLRGLLKIMEFRTNLGVFVVLDFPSDVVFEKY